MYLMIKSLHALILIYINILTYKEIYAKQKAFNKLQECEENDKIEKTNYVINSKISAEENIVISPAAAQIKIENEMDQDKEDFLKPNQCKCLDDISEIPKNNNGGNIAFNQTSCSLKSFNKGSGQRVVAFTIYGMDMSLRTFKQKGYFEGIKGNLDLIEKYYPGWDMRLYCDFMEIPQPMFQELCNLACQNEHFDICDMKNLPGQPLKDASKTYPTFWRYFPTLDLQVDMFISRDLDSRINEREHAAVQEWVESKRAFHMIRDMPEQLSIDWPILAGLWGCRLVDPVIRSHWNRIWKSSLEQQWMWAKGNGGHYGLDQSFLKNFIQPLLNENNSIAHDSYGCDVPDVKYPYTRPFPIERKLELDNFAGAVPSDRHMIATPCPEACRPVEHLDWKYC